MADKGSAPSLFYRLGGGTPATAFAVLILAAAVLVIRYGHVRFPYQLLTRSGKLGQGND